MPELPEVETIKSQLASVILGKQVNDVVVVEPIMLQSDAGILRTLVVGAKIVKLGRFGKYLWMELDNGRYLLFHLKLNGRIFWRLAEGQPDQYTGVIFYFDGGMQLRLVDSRKFAYVRLLESREQLEKEAKKVGPEPGFGLTLGDFHERLRKTRRRIKDVLLDQAVIGGVGNIYANDALWLAKIHPATPVNQIPIEKLTNLFTALESVIAESLRVGGASEQWFRHVDGSIGHYQDYFKVYARAGQSCLVHPQEVVIYSKISGRGTFSCPICQPINN